MKIQLIYWGIFQCLLLSGVSSFTSPYYHDINKNKYGVKSIIRIRKERVRGCRSAFAPPVEVPLIRLCAENKDNSDNTPNKKSNNSNKKKKGKNPKSSTADDRSKRKEEIMKQLKANLDEKKKQEQQQQKDSPGLLSNLNPYKVGQNFRQTLDRLTAMGSGLSSETKQKYYLDDRFLEEGSSGAALFSERNPYLDRQDNYVPEVLVVGATGEVGRLVVRRLLLEGRFRVRVLVRDLYSKTLNLLGTGVTYCQGDLGNVESLEYALTDVDKIVFCAGAPRPDEADFQDKFQYFVNENLEKTTKLPDEEAKTDMEWEQLSSVLEVRAQLAEQVDCIGMQNLVSAYQNVRHADYGTSQAAKRSLFKFSGRPEDFYLFSLDDDDDDNSPPSSAATPTSKVKEDTTKKEIKTKSASVPKSSYVAGDEYEENDEYDSYDEENYEDYYDDKDYNDLEEYQNVESRRDTSVKLQVKWIRNEFGKGVFVGKVPKASSSGVGGEAAIISSRLRSRDDPENGIDLSAGFGGFIVRLCGDGGNFEAFVRTESFDDKGIEYVYEFPTFTKPTSKDNKSRNKFVTVRLPFDGFKPVMRKSTSGDVPTTFSSFDGSDVRKIGFRFRSSSNTNTPKKEKDEFVSFYIALDFIKVYRLQPEPEFIYLSDGRIPPVVRNGMIRHDRRTLMIDEDGSSSGDGTGDVIKLFDEKTLVGRSSEEMYYKFRGEEILKNSGMSYTIIRVSGFNELPSGESSTIELKPSNSDLSPVSRDEAAQVCVSALLDPNALNKSVYMGKNQNSGGSKINDNISAKFMAVPTDSKRRNQ